MLKGIKNKFGHRIYKTEEKIWCYILSIVSFKCVKC